jgi:hypothetical protein
MKIMSWHLSNLLPSSPPIYLSGFYGLIWKIYAYLVTMGILTLITGGICFLYSFEIVHRLNSSYRQRSIKTKTISLSLNKIRA